ncbi:MAG: hypothetical protein OEY06_12020 [Gammaproteobacteria bacterium]|nr:hypothetical protein [Gammaproteobacteria bacterium]
MEGISDIRISGIDVNRPPLIRKEPYIDLFFALTHKAPKDWCDDFNLLVSKQKNAAKIVPAKGLFIEAWVRKPDEIEILLRALKKAVEVCSEEYIAKINAAISAASSSQKKKTGDEGEQGRLNKIIAALDFD